MDISAFITTVVQKDREGMKKFLDKDLQVRWHNTNEKFTLEEYLEVNCSYPGNWLGEVKSLIPTNKGCVVVAKISSEDKKSQFHQVSIIEIKDDKIIALDEYYSEDGPAPQWRLDKNIGNKINE